MVPRNRYVCVNMFACGRFSVIFPASKNDEYTPLGPVRSTSDSARGIHKLLRGTIVNRTHGRHKNLYIKPFLPSIFGPINYGPP